MELLSDVDSVAALLAPLLDALSADPWFQPPCRVLRGDGRTGIVLWEGAAGVLTLTVAGNAGGVTARSAEVAVAVGRPVAIRFHRSGGAMLHRWQVSPATADFVAATAPRAVALPPLPLQDGAVMLLDGRHQAWVVEGGQGDLVSLSFAAAPDCGAGDGLVREYRRDDGRLHRIATSDDQVSRTRMMLTLLRVQGRADAGHLFDAATRVAAFHLRWAAMREWLGLDVAAALPRLHEMALNDPHPEVRAAAAATLPLAAGAVEEGPCRA